MKTLLQVVVDAGLLDEGAMLTTREAAERLGINTSRVRQLIIRKQLKAEKHGRDWMIEPDEVERFQRERRLVGRPKKNGRGEERGGEEKEP